MCHTYSPAEASKKGCGRKKRRFRAHSRSVEDASSKSTAHLEVVLPFCFVIPSPNSGLNLLGLDSNSVVPETPLV